MKKLFRKLINRFFCYWCWQKGVYRLGVQYGRYPIDCDIDDDNTAIPIYANVNLCRQHLDEFENGEGVYEREW